MKTAFAALIVLGLASGVANASSPFDGAHTSAPRSPFTELNNVGPRSYFDQLNETAPRSTGSVFGDQGVAAPRSETVFGTQGVAAP